MNIKLAQLGKYCKIKSWSFTHRKLKEGSNMAFVLGASPKYITENNHKNLSTWDNPIKIIRDLIGSFRFNGIGLKKICVSPDVYSDIAMNTTMAYAYNDCITLLSIYILGVKICKLDFGVDTINAEPKNFCDCEKTKEIQTKVLSKHIQRIIEDSL